MNLGTNDINIVLADTPTDAPNYTAPEYQAANLKTAVIVGQGTVSGKPTIDFVFEDANGQKYIAMLTGALLESVAAASEGMKQRTKGKGQ